MKKIYLFIFLIVIGFSQNQSAKANISKTTNKVAPAPVNQTINFTAFTTTQTFGNADVTLAATATSGLAVTFSSSNTAVATIVSGKIHITGVGTAVITASQPGNGTGYNAAPNQTQNLTVNAGAKAVISAFPAATLALASADAVLPAVSTYTAANFPNYPITYTSSNPAVATIINGRLHMVATGTTTITASQAGNGNFPDATPVAVVYTINPPVLTFTTALTGKTVGSADFDPAATSAAYFATINYTSSNPALVSIVSNRLHFIGAVTAGSVTITASITYPVGTGGTATVQASLSTLVVTVPTVTTPAPAISFTAPGSKAFTTIDLALTATSTSTANIPITFTSSNPAVATIVNGNIHFVGLGTSTITASQGGGNDPSLPVNVGAANNLTVTAPTLTLTAPGSKTFTNTDFTPTVATSLPNIPITLTSSNLAVATIVNGNIHFVGNGTATITASQGSSAASTLGYITPLLITTPGSAYTNATYSNVPLTGGTGTGATATVVVAGAVVTTVTVVNIGSGYKAGDVLSVAASTVGGTGSGFTATVPAVGVLGNINAITGTIGGSAYTAGTYNSVPLTGGTGTGATANITVANGSVVNVVIVNGGSNYKSTDVLSCAASSIGGTGSGFSITGVSTTILPPDSFTANNLTVTGAAAPTAAAIAFAALGTKTYSTSELGISATSTSTSTNPIVFTSSNPSVALITNTLALGPPNGGSSYTNGTYLNVPLTGGSGTGELATVIVANGIVNTVTPSTNGTGYLAGDVLSCSPAAIGGTGSGFNIAVLSLTYNIRYASVPAAPNNTAIITASQGGGVLGNATLPPDVQNTLVVVPPAITFPTLGTKAYSAQDIPVGASSTTANKIIVYTSSNPAVATINNTISGSITTAGTGYTGATYYKVPMLGGTGSGATATIVTASNVVNSVTVTANGGLYTIGDILTCSPALIGNGSGFTYTVNNYTSTIHYNNAVPAAPNNTTTITASQGGGATGLAGYVIGYSLLTGGSNYVSGTYNNVALTGGVGSGATANITVSNGAVTSVIITAGGSGYVTGNALSAATANIGGGTGSGFIINVNTIVLPPDASQVLTVTQPAINFPALGTKQLSSNDLNPGATGSTFTTNSVSTLSAPTAGSGYTNGVYYAVPLTGGSGSGLTATVTVIGGVITSVLPVSTGINYLVGDILTTANTNIGGTGSGFSISVTAISTGFPVTYTSSNPAVATIVNNYIHFVSAGTTTITASQSGPAGANTGTVSLPASVSQLLTVTPPTISFALSGTRTLSSSDVNPGATSTITNVPITYTSSAAAVATITNNSITAVVSLVRGSGYTNGIYINVPLTGGSGTGATANLTVTTVSSVTVGGVVVSTVNSVTGFQIVSAGTGYVAGDILTCAPTAIGGTSTSIPFNIKVATVGSFLHFVGAGTVSITASQGGGAAGTTSLPADVTQTLTINPSVLTLPALGRALISTTDINPAATSSITNVPITYSSSNTAVATILPNSITSLNNPVGGTGYVIGTYSPVPLIYANNVTGTGTGATAQILVVGGSVTGVTILSGGTGYAANDLLTCASAGVGGSGTGFTVSVASAGGVIHFTGAPASPGNTTTITATQGGGVSGTGILPPDATQVLTVLPYTLTMPAFGAQNLSNTDLNPGATSTQPTVPITYTSSNTAVATIVNGFIHFVSAGTTTITASQGGGATGTPLLPADFSQKLVLTAPAITFPPLSPAYTTNVGDIAPGASSTVTSPAITYTSSNTAVATIVSGNIHVVGAGTAVITASQGSGSTPGPIVGFTNIVGGSAYTNGTYTGVALTGGAGTGAKATIVVAGGIVTSVVITTGGTAYLQNSTLSAASASIGGTGSGFSVVGLTSVNLPPDVSQTLTITIPAITLPVYGTKVYSDVDLDPGASSPVAGIAFNYTSSNPAVATIVRYPVFSIPFNGGSGYTNGTYANVPLLFNGLTNGVTATVIVANGSVTSVATQSITITPGNGTVVTINPSAIGNTGSGYSATIVGVNSMIHYNPVIQTAPNNKTTITASQTQSGATPASQDLTLIAPVITFPAFGTVNYSNIDFSVGATSSVAGIPIIYTSSNPAVATIVNGQIHIINAGATNIKASQGGGTTGANGIPADVTQALTITGTPLITFAATATKQYTTTDVAPGATSTYSLAPITYTITNPTGGVSTIASIQNGNIHFLTAPAAPNNTFKIIASQGGGTTSNGVIPIDVTQTVTVTVPTITFTTTQLPATKAITDIDFSPGATSTVTTTPITYTSNDATIATITADGNIHLKGNIGTVKITASQGGGSAGTTTLPADVSLNVAVTAPVITFAALTAKPYQVNDIGLTATSTLSTIPITYTSSDPTVATIVNGSLHITGIGTTTITASQNAAAIAAGYTAPADVTQAFTVSAPTLTLVALGAKVFTSTDLPLTTTGSISSAALVTYTSSDPSVATIVNNAIHYVGIGTCYITASQASFNGSSAPLSSIQTLTVTPAVITNPALGTKLLNSGDAALGASSTLSITAFPIIYTSSDPTVASITGGSNLHLVGPGTCVITASQGTTANYAPAPVPVTLVITPAISSVTTPTITFAAIGIKQYTNTSDIVPAATASNGAVLTFTSSNPAVATIVNGNVHLTPPAIVNGVVTYPTNNTSVITASAGGGATGVPGSVPADASQTITVTPASITFPLLGSQIIPATPVIPNLSQIRFSTNDLAPAATSTYITLTAANTAVPITYTSSNPAVATIVNGQVHSVGLGSTIITASLGNVYVPDVSQNLEVIAPAITLGATRSVAFSNVDFAPGATSTLASVPITYTSSNPAVATINANGFIHMVSAGITTITATQPAIGNSTIPPAATQTLTITPSGTLTFATTRTAAFTLTDQDPGATSTITTTPITYTSSNPALVSIVNNKLHFVGPQTTISNGNTVIITATQAGTGGVPTQIASQVLTITPLVIIPSTILRYYGDGDFSPGVSSLGATSTVLYASATATVATTVTNGATVSPGQFIHIVGTGTSAITASSPADNANPAAANGTSTLTVAAAPMSITPKNVTATYGTPLISLPLIYDGFKSASGGVPLDDSTKFTAQPVVSIKGQSPNGFFGNIPVGTYQLTAFGAASTLYTFTYGSGTLTIVPAVQTLTWDNFNGNRTISDPDFDPLARSTGDPIVYTSSNTAVATIVNGKVHIVGVGTTTITASISPTSGNYTGTASIAKTVTVSQGAQTITVASIPGLVKGAAAYSPNAIASSGLAVTMVSSDPTIVKVVGTTLVPLHVGNATITFSQPGNASYLPAANVTLFVLVTDPSGVSVKVDQAVSPNGDGINDFLYIEGIQNYPDNHVKIINRNGDKVYGTIGYNNKNVAFTGKDNNGHQLPEGTYFYLIDWKTGGDENHITGYFVLKY